MAPSGSVKLKIPQRAQSTDGAAAPATPSSTGNATPTLKLKNSQHSVPTVASTGTGQTFATPTQPASKAKKTRKPAAAGSKKRTANDDTISPAPKRPAAANRKISINLKGPSAPHPAAANSDDVPLSAGGLNKIPLKRRPTVPRLRGLNNTRRPPPVRLPGHGYDSEDSEAEEDPAIQQAFILRMQPGEDCEYVRQAIANGKIGLNLNEGGADISLRFLDKDARRAVLTVKGRMYAAALVDLPCIVETMKSWDRKGWWKVADLNQMLLVLGRVPSDEEAKNYPLPTREVDKTTMQYAHGLTPPMHWVRKRRFRKRLSYKTIANVEEEVERLLKEDELVEQAGGDVTYEIMDRAAMERGQDDGESGYAEDEDAEMEPVDTIEGDGQDEYEDEYPEDDDGDDAGDLEGNLQAMFDEANTSSSAAPTTAPAAELVPASQIPIVDQAPAFAAVENAMAATAAETLSVAAETPAEITTQDEADEEEEDAGESSGSDDESDEDEDSPDVMDEDAIAKVAERNQQLEEVRDLEREVEAQKKKVAAIKNRLLQERARAQLEVLEADLRMKKAVVFGDEDAEGTGEGESGA